MLRVSAITELLMEGRIILFMYPMHVRVVFPDGIGSLATPHSGIVMVKADYP